MSDKRSGTNKINTKACATAMIQRKQVKQYDSKQSMYVKVEVIAQVKTI
jgi:hypothetical protein